MEGWKGGLRTLDAPDLLICAASGAPGPSAPLDALGQCLCSRGCKGPLQTNNGNQFSNELEGRRLRRPLEFGQFPSRFRQSGGRGRPSHIVARASPPASKFFARSGGRNGQPPRK